MAAPAWYRDIEAVLGDRPLSHRALSGGCIGAVYRVDMPGGGTVVVKRDQSGLVLEGWMLAYLARHSALPVPEVIDASDHMLIMSYLPAGDPIDDSAQTEAAEMLAALHGVEGPAFGLERDTVIAGLPQPNPPGPDWIAFFRDQRLRHMARRCLEIGRIDTALVRRIERLAAKLPELLVPPSAPGLIHGDMWTGNVLVRDGRISGFVDPAIYYADPEIELAFATLFGTFGDAFFARYREIRPLKPGFFSVRRDIYNLWPLLTHVHLFGAGYLPGILRVLDRHGA